MSKQKEIEPSMLLIAEQLEEISARIRGGHCHASHEQLMQLASLTRIMASPASQLLTIGEICKDRWHISKSTLYNWIDLGLVPPGHQHKHCTTVFWYSDDIDRAERELRRLGYIKTSIVSRCASFLKERCSLLF